MTILGLLVFMFWLSANIVSACLRTAADSVVVVSTTTTSTTTTTTTTTTPTCFTNVCTCPDANWVLYTDPSNGAGYCFQMTTTDTDWADAPAQCAALDPNAKLAWISSDDEQQFLLNEYEPTSALPWIGLYSTSATPGDTVNWMWVTGDPYVYQAGWENLYPSGTGMRCVREDFWILIAVGWYDDDCTILTNALCKLPATVQP